MNKTAGQYKEVILNCRSIFEKKESIMEQLGEFFGLVRLPINFLLKRSAFVPSKKQAKIR